MTNRRPRLSTVKNTSPSPHNSAARDADRRFSVSGASADGSAADLSVEDLVYYAGRWTEEDANCVSEALRQIERRGALGNANRALGEPWVCTCQPIHGGLLYTAHRIGYPTPLSARSRRALILRLYTWAMQLETG